MGRNETINITIDNLIDRGGKRISAYLSDGFLNVYGDAMLVEVVHKMSERLADEMMDEMRAKLKPVLMRKLEKLAELL